jgi:hypothetical protein
MTLGNMRELGGQSTRLSWDSDQTQHSVFRSTGKRCRGMKHATHGQQAPGCGDGVVVEDSFPRICHSNQYVSQTDRVFFDIAEFQEALMADTPLPAMYDARMFTIVVQQLGVGHGLHRSGLNGFPVECGFLMVNKLLSIAFA